MSHMCVLSAYKSYFVVVEKKQTFVLYFWNYCGIPHHRTAIILTSLLERARFYCIVFYFLILDAKELRFCQI